MKSRNNAFFDDDEEIKTVSDYDEDNLDKIVALNLKKAQSNNQNKIDQHQVNDISLSFSENDVDSLCNKLEKDGKIDYQSFITHLAGMNSSKSKKVLKATFDKLDVNGDQTVTSEELKKLLLQSDNMNEQEQVFFKQIMDQMDKNMNAKISFKEFEALMQSLLVPIHKE